jgi:hypothetical protein
MALINQGGKLLLRDGALGTGQGCCCGGGCNTASSFCFRNGSRDASKTTQAECEECSQVNVCQEYQFLENPEATCPDGWTPDGWGGCSRVTNPANCADCPGWCDQQNVGSCGAWVEGTIPQFCECGQASACEENCPGGIAWANADYEAGAQCDYACCNGCCYPHAVIGPGACWYTQLNECHDDLGDFGAPPGTPLFAVHCHCSPLPDVNANVGCFTTTHIFVPGGSCDDGNPAENPLP